MSASRALVAHVVGPNQSRQRSGSDSSSKEGTGQCNCKKSKCLKLYCECFAANRLCSGCNCKDCHNDSAHLEEREKALRSAESRDSGAFKVKVVGGTHYKGCHCKKSACQKKYCECYAEGVKCGDLCRCVGCKNLGPGQVARDPPTNLGPPKPADIKRMQQLHEQRLQALQSPMGGKGGVPAASPSTMNAVNVLCSFPYGSEPTNTSSPVTWSQANLLGSSIASMQSQIGQPAGALWTVPEPCNVSQASAISQLATSSSAGSSELTVPVEAVPNPTPKAHAVTAAPNSEQHMEYLHVIIQELDEYRIDFTSQTARLRERLRQHEGEEQERQTEIDNAFFNLHTLLQSKGADVRGRDQREYQDLQGVTQGELVALEERANAIDRLRPAIEAVVGSQGAEGDVSTVTANANQLVELCRGMLPPASPKKRPRIDITGLEEAVNRFVLPVGQGQPQLEGAAERPTFVMPSAPTPVPLFHNSFSTESLTPATPATPATHETPDLAGAMLTPTTNEFDRYGSGIDVALKLKQAQEEGEDTQEEAAKRQKIAEGFIKVEEGTVADVSPPSPLATSRHNSGGSSNSTGLIKTGSLDSLQGVDLFAARGELELQGYSPGMKAIYD